MHVQEQIAISEFRVQLNNKLVASEQRGINLEDLKSLADGVDSEMLMEAIVHGFVNRDFILKLSIPHHLNKQKEPTVLFLPTTYTEMSEEDDFIHFIQYLAPFGFVINRLLGHQNKKAGHKLLLKPYAKHVFFSYMQSIEATWTEQICLLYLLNMFVVGGSLSLPGQDLGRILSTSHLLKLLRYMEAGCALSDHDLISVVMYEGPYFKLSYKSLALLEGVVI